MKKIIPAVLPVILLASVFAACGNGHGAGGNTSGGAVGTEPGNIFYRGDRGIPANGLYRPS